MRPAGLPPPHQPPRHQTHGPRLGTAQKSGKEKSPLITGSTRLDAEAVVTVKNFNTQQLLPLPEGLHRAGLHTSRGGNGRLGGHVLKSKGCSHHGRALIHGAGTPTIS